MPFNSALHLSAPLNFLVRLSVGLALVTLIGCDPSVETRPERILPVLKQAQRCCDGQCSGPYKDISRGVACDDVTQLESCLAGNRDQCPAKGYGSF